MKFQQNRERGAVLLTTVVIAGVVIILIAALLTVVRTQHTLTGRSQIWCSEIPVAEAGIEEALAHLNSKPIALAANGWTTSGSNVVKARYFTNGSSPFADGYFYTAISSTMPPVIVSVGYGRVPMATNYTRRTISVLTKLNSNLYGIIAKGKIKSGGSSVFDSFNSSDPTKSTGGRYDVTKRGDGATVATLDKSANAIKVGTIYGYAATGPGGDVTGTVGDGAWVSSHSGVQYAHERDDFNVSIPDVPTPTTATGWNPVPPGNVLLSADYKINGDLTSGMKITGNARLWVTGKVKITGSDDFIIKAGGTIEIYLGGNADFGGGGVINETTVATSCKIYGLKTCTSIDFHGNASVTAVIYAPNAAVDLGGTPDLYGSLVAKSIDMSGNSGIHYDEALGPTVGPRVIVSAWEEL